MNRNTTVGALASVFLLPSFILTVVPTMRADPGLGVCMAFGVLLLPFIPFAMRHAHGAQYKAALAVLGVALLAYNGTNALDALNRGRDAATNGARTRMTSATSIHARIDTLTAAKQGIPAHTMVSKGGAEAAQRARDDECKTGHGPLCRGLDRELATINQYRALTERAEQVEGELKAAQRELADLGPVEATADRTATQLAQLASMFWAPAAASGDDISVNRPIFIAAIVEAISGAAPFIFVTIFGTKPAPTKPLPSRKQRRLAKTATKESVLEWHKQRVIHRERRTIRAGDAYGDFEIWCEANGLGAVNQKVFAKVLKDELGIRRNRKDNRVSYLDIGLKPKLKLRQSLSPNQCHINGEDRDPGDGSSPPRRLH